MRILILFLLASALFAQDKKPTEYVNTDLGLKFKGVYGWEKKALSGSGAWTELARYSNRQLDAYVVLFVRDNPYETTSEMREAMENEFKAGGEPAADKPAYKDVAFKDVAMKRGLKLPGLEMEAYLVSINEAGKKREHKLVVRTYFGRNRLFRVYCSARRSRAKRVRDLFQIATSGVSVTATDERVTRGFALSSQEGGYSLIVPDGFQGVRPTDRSNSDMRFHNRRLAIRVVVFAYSYDLELIDHIEEMQEYYGDNLTIENEEAKVFGATGFVGKVVKDGKVTLIAGALKSGRVYRLHTQGAKDKLEDLKRVQAAFMKTFQTARGR